MALYIIYIYMYIHVYIEDIYFIGGGGVVSYIAY